MINILILLFLLLLITYRYEKGFIVFASFFFFAQSIPSGIGNATIYFIVTMYLLLIYWIRKLKRKEKSNMPFPKIWINSILLLSVCCLITEFVSGFKNYQGWVNLVVSSFVFPFLLWKFINSPQRLQKLIKGLKTSLFIIVLYAIIEQLIHSNPLSQLLYPSDETTYAKNVLGELAFRYGLYRCKSLLVFSSTLGCFGITMAYLFFQVKNMTNYFQYKNKSRLSNYKLLLLLCFIAIAFSTTRSVFLVTFIIAMGCILQYRNSISKSNTSIYIIGILGLIFFFLGGGDDLINTMFGSMNKNNIGSSPEMRMNQLDISLYYFNQSPIWGNGLNYIFKVVSEQDPDIYGAESIWFQLLVNYGIVGCITYTIFVFTIGKKLWTYNKYFIIFPLAIFIGKTTSILMDVEYDYYLYVAIMIIKIYTYKNYLRKQKYPNIPISQSSIN